MAMNRIQFQAGPSLPGLLEQFGDSVPDVDMSICMSLNIIQLMNPVSMFEVLPGWYRLGTWFEGNAEAQNLLKTGITSFAAAYFLGDSPLGDRDLRSAGFLGKRPI